MSWGVLFLWRNSSLLVFLIAMPLETLSIHVFPFSLKKTPPQQKLHLFEPRISGYYRNDKVLSYTRFFRENKLAYQDPELDSAVVLKTPPLLWHRYFTSSFCKSSLGAAGLLLLFTLGMDSVDRNNSVFVCVGHKDILEVELVCRLMCNVFTATLLLHQLSLSNTSL